MKVNIYETVEISDAQRVELANVLDGKINKPKRQATRDEIKTFIWDEGNGWEKVLADLVNELAAETGTEAEPEDEPEDEPEAEDEDLLGDSDEDEDLLG